MQLRSLINNVIHDASEDLRMQRSAGNEAFDSHCRQLDEAKLRLEQHLQQVGFGISGICGVCGVLEFICQKNWFSPRRG